MKKSDIVRVGFTVREIQEAREWQEYMDAKNQGAKTINLSKNKNMAGYLGHLAVEKALFYNGFTDFSTSRRMKFDKGDAYDIYYDGDFLDVKAINHNTAGENLDAMESWVWDWHEHKQETHFVFTRIDKDWKTGYIVGVMKQEEFWVVSEESKYIAPHHFVRLPQLQKFTNYIMRY